jgi:hypothetical protein
VKVLGRRTFLSEDFSTTGVRRCVGLEENLEKMLGVREMLEK